MVITHINRGQAVIARMDILKYTYPSNFRYDLDTLKRIVTAKGN